MSTRSDAGSEDVHVVGGPSPLPCHVGDFSEHASIAQTQDVLSRPDAYVNKRIRVKGYFSMGFEQVALIEPLQRKEVVWLNISRLPVSSAMDLKACHLKLVEVEGVLKRGRKNQPLLKAEAMSSAVFPGRAR
jgi:hypothetical protein